MAVPLAVAADVAAIWRPLSDTETTQVTTLIVKASAKLRQACPFDIDARIAQFAADPTVQPSLDPVVVADVVATIVKRFMVNVEGVATSSETVGPYSKSATYVNRYDKTGSDVRGAIQVTDSDIDQLRPSTPAFTPGTFRIGVPHPKVLLPGAGIAGRGVVVDERGMNESDTEWVGGFVQDACDDDPTGDERFEPPSDLMDGGDL